MDDTVAFQYAGTVTGRFTHSSNPIQEMQRVQRFGKTYGMGVGKLGEAMRRFESKGERDNRVAFNVRCPHCKAEAGQLCTVVPNKGVLVMNRLKRTKTLKVKKRPYWNMHEERLTKARLIDDEQGPP